MGPCNYPPNYPYPPMYTPPYNPYPPHPPVNSIDQIKETLRFYKSLLNEEKKKKKDEFNPDDWIKKPKPKTFTVPELAGWLFLLWPIVGLAEIGIVKYMLALLQ